ncbi:MAG: hypothetical protein QOH57_3051 [Mycobacterium sp.]|jgi:hypothetical protein|nr:hypothetical protein [Mycobacterium sp.]
MENRSVHWSPTTRRGEAPVKPQPIRLKPTTILSLVLTALWTLAAIIFVSPTAHADPNYQRFKSPSGDIVCTIIRGSNIWDPANYGKGEGTCQVQYFTYPVPPREYVAADGQVSHCYFNGWGGQFSLPEGRPPHLTCTGSDLVSAQPLRTLDYGQSTSLGAITCASEPSGMTCTDNSSGRFFRVSPDSYQLG